MIKTKKFCDIHKIPYITIGVNIKKVKRNGKGWINEKIIYGIPKKFKDKKKTILFSKYKDYYEDNLDDEKWTEWDYKKCMKFNKEFYDKKTCNALNINLTNSKFMIIDIDAWDKEKDIPNEILVKQYLEEYGDYNQSTSTRKKLPHLWRLKHEDDKNTTKTGFKKGLDLIYTNVFEWIDSTIENYTEEIPIFNHYPKVIENNNNNENKKNTFKKNKTKKEKVETNSIDSGIENDNKLKAYLDLIPNDIDYDTWFKIVCSLKNENENNYDMCLEWCKKSDRHTDEHFNHVWDYCDERNTIGTLYYYCNLYNPYEYRLLQLNKSLCDSDDNLSSIFINLQSENLIYTNEELFIYKKNWIRDDKKNQHLKKLIRITLRNFSIHLDTENNKQILLSIDDEDKTALLQSKKKQINNILDASSSNNKINNICSLVLQDLAYLDKDIKFDLCPKQIYNLHFKNGVYELDTKTFRKRTQKDYITKYLDWDYIPKDKIDEDIYNEIDNFYSKLQPDLEQKQFSLEWMAYCLSGSCGKQRFKMNIGYSAGNGKSTEFKIHDKVFDIYSFKLDNKTFNEKNDKKHKQLIHLIKNPIRFSYCEELKQDKLDIDFIKDFVDGSKINCEIMYGTSESHSIQAKLTTCSNKDFNADIDGGILRRGLVQFYDSKFRLDVEDNYETHIYKRIDEYETRFDNIEYKNAYLHLLLSYYNKDFKVPKSNENAFKDIGNEYDDLQNILDTYFTITNDDKDLVNKKQMETMFKSTVKLSWRELLSKLKSKGLKYNKEKKYKKCKGVFLGIKLNEEDFLNDE